MLLKPGRTCDDGLRLLQDVENTGLNDVQNSIPFIRPTMRGNEVVYPDRLQSGTLDPVLRQYDAWTKAAATELMTVFDDLAITAPLRGGRYGLILGADPMAARTAQLLHAELSELRTYFQDLANRLRAIKEHYKRHQGRSLILDTNVLLHGENFTKIPWTKIYGKGAVVVLPHVVIDEIDKKSYAQSDKIRKRGRTVFRELAGLLDELSKAGHATLEDGTPFEVLKDEPGHVRLANCDDEIVARACALQQAVSPSEVTVVTLDNGMRVRAMAWELKASPLEEKYRIAEPPVIES
jgi:hypothetical protein